MLRACFALIAIGLEISSDYHEHVEVFRMQCEISITSYSSAVSVIQFEGRMLDSDQQCMQKIQTQYL